MTDELDNLTVEEMVARAKGTDDAWTALFRAPDAHLRWREAAHRRKWLEAFAHIAGLSPANAGILGRVRRSALPAGPERLPPALIARRPLDVSGALAATLKGTGNLLSPPGPSGFRSSTRNASRDRSDPLKVATGEFPGIADVVESAFELARSAFPKQATRDSAAEKTDALPFLWGAITHADFPIGRHVDLRIPHDTNAWWVAGTARGRWPDGGWKVEAEDGPVAVVCTSPAVPKAKDLADVPTENLHVAIAVIHGIVPTRENED